MELLGVTCCLHDASTNTSVDLLKQDKTIAPLPATVETSDTPSTQQGDNQETDSINFQMDDDEKESSDDIVEIEEEEEEEEEEEKPTIASISKPESQFQNEAIVPQEQNDGNNFPYGLNFGSSIIDFVKERLKMKPIVGIANVIEDSEKGAIEEDVDKTSHAANVASGDDAITDNMAAVDESIEKISNNDIVNIVDHHEAQGDAIHDSIKMNENEKDVHLEEEKKEEEDDDEVYSNESTTTAKTMFEDTLLWLQKVLKKPEENEQSLPPNDSTNQVGMLENDIHVSTTSEHEADSSLIPKLSQSITENGTSGGGGYSVGGVSEADSMSVKVESSVSSKASLTERKKPPIRKAQKFKPFKSIKKLFIGGPSRK